MVAEGLTHVATGAVLGALTATVTAAAGVSVATGSAHEPVERVVRGWSHDVVTGLRRTLER